MTPADLRSRLERAYANHPLTADAVLARVRAERGGLADLTEGDLATSLHGGATDQNHPGGTASTLAIASAVRLDSTWSVLDVGTGLGGTPRLLAAAYGCRGLGIELTAHRFRDAVRLTTMVGLANRVAFTQGDFLEADLPTRAFDLVIVQGALMHFPDLPACARRIASVLRPGGWCAVEEAFLARAVAANEQQMFRRLESHWNGTFPSVAEWNAHLGDAGLRPNARTDLTSLAISEFDRLIADHAAGWLPGVNSAELEGWRLGKQFLSDGLLVYARLLATSAA
jgi:SAM-dependent methyltransferase